MLGWAASCRIRPKCSRLGSWDRSNCNSPWSGLCTNYAQFAKTFDRMPMIGKAAMGKIKVGRCNKDNKRIVFTI